MKELVRKSVLWGIGIADLTIQKAEKFAKQYAKEAKLNKKEARKMVKSMMAESSKQGNKLKKMIRAEVEMALKKAGVATQADIKKLKKQIKK